MIRVNVINNSTGSRKNRDLVSLKRQTTNTFANECGVRAKSCFFFYLRLTVDDLISFVFCLVLFLFVYSYSWEGDKKNGISRCIGMPLRNEANKRIEVAHENSFLFLSGMFCVGLWVAKTVESAEMTRIKFQENEKHFLNCVKKHE